MRRDRFYYLMSAGFILILLVAFVLLIQDLGESFIDFSRNPWFVAGRIMVLLILAVCGVRGLVKVNEGASLADRSSRDFDAREALQQVRAGNLPADWIVFRASFKKVVGKRIALSFVLLLGVSPIAMSSLTSLPLFPVFAALLVLLFLALSLFLGWQAKKDAVLVITPEGFIQGNSYKPEKALRLKYRDITDIQIIGETVTVQARDNWGKQRLDCTFFTAPSRSVASALFTAFSRFDSTGALAKAPRSDSLASNAREVFQQVRAGNISADWTVFRTSGTRMFIRSILLGVGLLTLIGYLDLYVLSILFVVGVHPFFGLLLPIGCVVFLALFFFSTWRKRRDEILVVMPEGFVHGRESQPEKALCLPYQDIAEMHTLGETVILKHKDHREQKSIKCSLFPSKSKGCATMLFAAFSRYKAYYPEKLMTIAPMIVSANPQLGQGEERPL